jgi:hypothetical protein
VLREHRKDQLLQGRQMPWRGRRPVRARETARYRPQAASVHRREPSATTVSFF